MPALRLLLIGPAALLPNDHHSAPAQFAEYAHNRRIVPKLPVAVQFNQTGEQPCDVVQRRRASGMTCQLHGVPRRRG